ncbi:MAG: 50S ribosomal protein L22 [Candidatus Rokubacteria bacterium]|nr:50S ribosomal protein L22 [Candidatus Rokubacteria bacterium]
MLTKAVTRFIRVSPSKARLVANVIRGRRVGEALSILQYSPQAAARLIEKTLRSAIANAEHNHQVRGFEDLRVGVFVDGGPALKRIQPRAMGRAYRIRHRTSHITVTLSQAGDGQPLAAGRPGRRAAQDRPARGGAPAAETGRVRARDRAAGRAAAKRR